MKILLHRKDNIGDAVLSLPLIQVLRRHWPSALIDYWGPSYVTPVMTWCPELSEVKSYTKLKHAKGFSGLLASVFSKVLQLGDLRLRRYDIMLYIGEGSTPDAMRTIGYVRPKRAIAFTGLSHFVSRRIELVYSPSSERQAEHLEILKLARALDIPGPYHWYMPLLRPPRNITMTRTTLAEAAEIGPIIGIHLSARRRRQQWPIKNFELLIKLLALRFLRVQILVTWSPGRKDDKLHPGDDEKASKLADLMTSASPPPPVQFKMTSTLPDLLRVQSACDVVFCSDGGAMHLAAALGKRVVAMFGDSDHSRWRPIGKGHRVITTTGRDVREIRVDRAMAEICIALADGRT